MKYTYSETSATLGSCGIQGKTWQAKDELERCGEEGPPRNGKRLKHQLKTDIRGVNVWRYASAMLDESSQVKSC